VVARKGCPSSRSSVERRPNAPCSRPRNRGLPGCAMGDRDANQSREALDPSQRALQRSGVKAGGHEGGKMTK